MTDDSSQQGSATGLDLGPEKTVMRAVVAAIQTRIFGGLFLLLPIVITFWIVYQLFEGLRDSVLLPVSRIVVRVAGGSAFARQFADVFETYVAPVISVFIVLAILYCLGLFVRSRLHQLVDWVLLRVPVVTTVYKAVRNVFQSLGQQGASSRFKKAVLVAFPHPGMRVPGFVTSRCKDAETGRTILCVYVPTTPVPTSGYMLLVPEEDVTELDWDLEESLQAIVSGGITVPPRVRYFPKL